MRDKFVSVCDQFDSSEKGCPCTLFCKFKHATYKVAPVVGNKDVPNRHLWQKQLT